MPPKESIERVRRWQIGFGIFAAFVMFATSGTRYISFGGILVILSAWAAMIYVAKAIYSFSNYIRSNFPDFYHHEELNAKKWFGFRRGALAQVSPFNSWLRDERGKGVRQKIKDLIADPHYIGSLEALYTYYRTAIAVVLIEFALLIAFGFLKLWA